MGGRSSIGQSIQSSIPKKTLHAIQRINAFEKTFKLYSFGPKALPDPCLSPFPYTELASIYHHRRWIKQQTGNHLCRHIKQIEHY